MRLRRLAWTACAALVCAPALSAQAADRPGVVAGPGAARAKAFATPMAVVEAGERPTLLNADINWHSVEADAFGPDDRPWCEPVDPSLPESSSNPRRRPLGACPLFASRQAAPTKAVVIEGLEDAVAGRVYSYHCTVVLGMTGTLLISPTSPTSPTSLTSPTEES